MKLSICGDVSTTYSQELFRELNVTALFGDVPKLFSDSDRVLINLECALTEKETPIDKKGPNLKGPLETADVLSQIGVTDCAISNNHIMDYGIPGINDTKDALTRLGLNYTGFGENYEDSRKNLVMEKDGKKVAIIAVCEHEYCYALDNRMGARPFDPFDTLEDVRLAKAQCDFVVVLYHGGKEQSIYPSPRLRKLCRAMIKFGADAILCQHSHCIGCYEEYKGGHILYGQGNFHFLDPDPRESWYSELTVEYDTKTNEIFFTPIRTTDDGIALAKGEDKENIMSAFYARNESLKNGEWKRGWHDFCISLKDRYLSVITKACQPESSENDNAYFAHMLDCEAHTDVWRELFPTWNQTNCK